MHLGNHILAAIYLAHLQSAHVQAAPSGEPGGSGGWLTHRIKGARGGRALHHRSAVGLAWSQVFHQHHQAARSADHADIAMLQAQIVEQRRYTLAQGRQGGIQVGGGQLFRAHFQQERRRRCLRRYNRRGGFLSARGGLIHRIVQPGVFELLALLGVRFRHPAREITHPGKQGLALGHTHGAA